MVVTVVPIPIPIPVHMCVPVSVCVSISVYLAISVCRAGGRAQDREVLCPQFSAVRKCADSEPSHRCSIHCERWLFFLFVHSLGALLVHPGRELGGPQLPIGLVRFQQATSGLEALKVADGVEDEQALEGW